MTKLKRYPEYKASGIEWIGDVPSGWEVKPFFAHAQERKAKNTGMIENNLLSLSYGNIVRRDIESNMGLLPESFETYQIVEPDDTVFRLTDLQNDQRSLRTGFVRERGIITSAYTACYFKGISPKYINRLMHAYDLLKVFYGMGGGLRQSLKYSDLRRIPLILPPPPEQQAIADFLDRETAHIDAVITKKTRLVGLLQEKRQATITHAVTKGLDLQAKMKDSGIEWIGAVPEGWTVTTFKRLLRVCNGQDYKMVESPDGLYPVIGSGGEFARASSYIFDGESVLLGRKGTIDKPLYVNCAFWTVDTMFYTKVDPKAFPKFCYYTATAIPFSFYSTNTAIPSMTQEALSNHCVSFPSFDEQQAIADYLDKQCAAIDAIITKTQRSIELLKEKRQTLITAAVTGQIDVRSW